MAEKDAHPILRLFEKKKTPMAQVPALRELFETAAASCAEGLGAAAVLAAESELARLSEVTAGSLLQTQSKAILIRYDVPSWGACVYVALGPKLVFASVDIFFGGDGSAKPPSSARALTAIEKQIAIRIADGVLGHHCRKLSSIIRFSTGTVDAAWEGAEELVDAPERAGLAAAIGIKPLGDDAVLYIPMEIMEDASGRLQRLTAVESTAHDANWSRQFHQRVVAGEVELTATAPGPPMTLGHVAALEPGSIIELEADALRTIRLESEGHAVFGGRLGQASGLFTIYLERILGDKSAPDR